MYNCAESSGVIQEINKEQFLTSVNQSKKAPYGKYKKQVNLNASNASDASEGSEDSDGFDDSDDSNSIPNIGNIV